MLQTGLPSCVALGRRRAEAVSQDGFCFLSTLWCMGTDMLDQSLDPRVLSTAATVREMVREHVIRPHPETNLSLDDMEGACAVTSYVLARVLRLLGHQQVEFVYGSFCNLDHCWVQVGSWIVDLTATQFDVGMPPVHVTHKNHMDYLLRKVDSEAEGWVHYWGCQSPRYYTTEILVILDSFRESAKAA